MNARLVVPWGNETVEPTSWKTTPFEINVLNLGFIVFTSALTGKGRCTSTPHLNWAER